MPTKINTKDLSKSVVNFEQEKFKPKTVKERPRSHLKDIEKRNSGIELTKVQTVFQTAKMTPRHSFTPNSKLEEFSRSKKPDWNPLT